MATSFPLAFGVDGTNVLTLAAPTGADERAAAGEALVLLDRLVGTQVPVKDLTVGDRDRALAVLYRELYGDRVRADAHCANCEARFEMRFRLSALAASRQPDGSAIGAPPAIRVNDSILRLPRVEDLHARDASDLLQRLLVEGDAPAPEAATQALAEADPALELELGGHCPDCGETQEVAFSMTRFFNAALAQDHDVLMREVHLLARHYHWGFGEILSLTRVERRSLYAFIVAEIEGTRVRIGGVA